MKFCWATLVVEDMERSLGFYRDMCGLPVARRFEPAPGEEICFLGQGDTLVELIVGQDRPVPGNKEGFTLGFQVESLDNMLETVGKAGIPVEKGPIQPGPHIRFFYVRDPDGYRVQFSQNLS